LYLGRPPVQGTTCTLHEEYCILEKQYYMLNLGSEFKKADITDCLLFFNVQGHTCIELSNP